MSALKKQTPTVCGLTPALFSIAIHTLLIALIWLAVHRLESMPAGAPHDNLALEWSRSQGAGAPMAPRPRTPVAHPVAAAPTDQSAIPALPIAAPEAGVNAGSGTGPATAAAGNLPVGVEFAGYLMRIRAKIERSISYPLSLRRRGVSGSVRLELLIGTRGELKNVEIVESSGTPELDELAVDAARRSSPFPREGTEDLKLKLPVQFKIL